MGTTPTEATMTSYDRVRWEALQSHWESRQDRRELPGWLVGAGERTVAAAEATGHAIADAVPERAKQAAGKAGAYAMDAALRPASSAVLALLNLVDEWAMELNDPRTVVTLAQRRGIPIDDYRELSSRSLEDCDRILTRHTLTWRSIGALEGGAMGALTLVPVAGLPASVAADTLVIQVLSVSIATQIAYAYGYDAKAPDERAFIDSLVSRTFLTQAAKAKPLTEVSKAAHATAGRVKWSQKVRSDHDVVRALERFMAKWYPKGRPVPIQHVAKALPLISIAIGAGANAHTLGQVAKDAQRVCQTRFLCDRYGLPLPVALRRLDVVDDEETQTLPG